MLITRFEARAPDSCCFVWRFAIMIETAVVRKVTITISYEQGSYSRLQSHTARLLLGILAVMLCAAQPARCQIQTVKVTGEK